MYPTTLANTVTVDGSLSNASGGRIYLASGSPDAQQTLDVAGAAGFGKAGVVTGDVILEGDLLLEFGRGQITTIQSGASLNLIGDARVADAGSTDSNSALSGLSTVAGQLNLNTYQGIDASLSTHGNLSITSSGVVTLGFDNPGLVGGGNLTIGGNLFNSGLLDVNKGTTVEVEGSGGISNHGSIDVAGGSLTSKALSGAATVEDGGDLEFGKASTASVTFGSGSNTLKLDDSKQFAGTISGLTNSDTIDLADLCYTSGKMTATYSGTASGGTLTLSNGATSVKLALVGDYTNSTWTLSSDGKGGTDLVDPTSSSGSTSSADSAQTNANTGAVVSSVAASANATPGLQQGSSNTGGATAAGQGHQAALALLAQYTASNFAVGGGDNGGAVVGPSPAVATPFLVNSHGLHHA